MSSMTIGRYEVVERIGIGGMGEVFRARVSGVEGFQKDVVVKVVLPEMQGEAEFERAFVDEAKLSVQLQHPNIVQTLDLGKHTDRLYIVMEYVDGHDVGHVLRTLRRRGERVPMPVAVFVAIEMLRGLDYAHKACAPDGTPMEIIHRDVTPGNVMLSFNGAVKLADFGIARFSSRSAQKTTTGFVKGKVAFMPPEQVESRGLHPATDVFAAALVLCTMLAGGHPLESASEAELIDRIRAGDIPLPGSQVEGIPRALDRVIKKALEPRLADRTKTAKEMLEALEAFVLDDHVRTGPGVLSSWLLQLYHDELVRRSQARGTAELVTANVDPPIGGVVPQSKSSSAQDAPVPGATALPEPRPDTDIPATRQMPASGAASGGRRALLLGVPAALVAASGAGMAGWLTRERVLLASLRKDCEGEWRILSTRDVAGGGAPGDPLAKGEDRRIVLTGTAEHGLRLLFKRGADEAISVPLDLEREGATIIGRYNGVPVKFWHGPAGDIARAERMNLKVRLRPLGSVLELEVSMFGEGLGTHEWALTTQRPL